MKCLTKDSKKQFVTAIKNKKISIKDLSSMSSSGRRDFFNNIVSDKKNAKDINYLFERQSLLKNQKRAMINWAKEVSGLKKETRTDMINKIQKLDKVLDGSQKQQFLEDLVEKRFGIHIDEKDAEALLSLANQVKKYKGVNTSKQFVEALEKVDVTNPKDKALLNKLRNDIKSTEYLKEVTRLEKKQAKLDKTTSPIERSELQKEIDAMKDKFKNAEKAALKVMKKVDISREQKKELIQLANQVFDSRTGNGGLKFGNAKVELDNVANEMIDKGTSDLTYKNVVGLPKSLKATADLSAALRQGKKVLTTNPAIWAKNFVKMFKVAGKGFTRGDGLDGVLADIYSRKNYQDGYYDKFLDVGVDEDAFPSSLPTKIPLFKHLYNASEQAYKGFLYGARADLMDAQIKNARRNGIPITESWRKGQGRLINGLTGRGHLGRAEPISDYVNAPFFSIRKLVGDLQFITDPLNPFNGLDNHARKFAAKNLVKDIAATASILYIANELRPGSATAESRSSDFGKIKIGDTRFDITGGMSSIAILASRLIQGSTINSKGIEKHMRGEEKDFASGDAMDLFFDFMRNKTAPIASVAMNIVDGENFKGDPLTVGGIAKDLFLPMPVETIYETIQSPDSAPLVAVAIADGLGVAANTYPVQRETNWNKSTSARLIQLKEKVGQEEFDAMNKEYDALVKNKVKNLLLNEEYLALTNDDKKQVMKDVQYNGQDEIFKNHHYKYRYKKNKPDKKLKQLSSI